MTFCKGVAGTRFQILLELVCTVIIGKTEGEVNGPRAVRRGGGDFAGVMKCKASVQILGRTDVMAPCCIRKQVNVPHASGVYRNPLEKWETFLGFTIRSSAPANPPCFAQALRRAPSFAPHADACRAKDGGGGGS